MTTCGFVSCHAIGFDFSSEMKNCFSSTFWTSLILMESETGFWTRICLDGPWWVPTVPALLNSQGCDNFRNTKVKSKAPKAFQVSNYRPLKFLMSGNIFVLISFVLHVTAHCLMFEASWQHIHIFLCICIILHIAVFINYFSKLWSMVKIQDY